MFMVLTRIVVTGAVAASGAIAAYLFSLYVKKREKERNDVINSNVCHLCEEDTSGDLRTMPCCGVKFHLNCLEAYVQSLTGCPIECPYVKCKKIPSLTEQQRSDYEKLLIPPEIKYYCHFCDTMRTNNSPRVLSCTHRFCAGCIKHYMMSFPMTGGNPQCPMLGCGSPISDELHDAIIKME